MNPESNSNPNLPKLPATIDSQHLSTSLLLSGLAQANGETSGGAPPGLSSAPTFAGLMHALRRRWMVGLLAATAAAAVTVTAVLILYPPLWLTQIRFQVAAKPDGFVVGAQGGHDGGEFNLYKAMQQALVGSPLVITRALKERLPNGKEVRDLEIVRDKGTGAVDWLEKAIKIDFLSGPEFMRVTLGAENPEEVAILLNAIGKAYLDTNVDMIKANRAEQMQALEERKRKLDEEYRMLLTQLAKHKDAAAGQDPQNLQRHQIAAQTDLSAAKSSLNNIQAQVNSAEAEISVLKGKLDALPNLLVPPDKLDEALRADFIGADYVKQVQQIIAEIDYVKTKLQFGAQPRELARLNPLLRQAQAGLERRREQIRPEVEKQYRDKVRSDANEALTTARARLSALKIQESAQEKQVEEQMLAVQALDKNASNKPLDQVVMEEKVQNAKGALDLIDRSIRLFAFEQPRPRVTQLQEAAVPTKKDYSRQIKLGGGGGLMMFGLVLFAVSFLEFRSRKISDTQEISRGLGISVVGALPAMPAKVRRGGTATDIGQIWTTQLNEAVDAVRTLILHASRTEALRVIMVTSADSGEGKTSLASQLAASLARSWRRTLLIDGDLRHPATHTLFDIQPEPGLSEVLRGEVQAPDAIRATPLSRFWVLPAGAWDQHAIQALAQDDVRTLVEELKQQYDYIVIDSPPVLPVADSLLLGQHVDGVLFAILRDVSRAPAVYAAQQKLQPLGIRILGAVMVGAEAELGRGRYRYLSQRTEGGV